MTDIREETNQQEQPFGEFNKEPRHEVQPLPTGSVVIQAVPTIKDGEAHIEIAGILIGTDQFDAANPCHRLLAVFGKYSAQIMAEVNGELPTDAANDAADQAAAG